MKPDSSHIGTLLLDTTSTSFNKENVRNKENHSNLKSKTSCSEKLWHLHVLGDGQKLTEHGHEQPGPAGPFLCGLIKPNDPQRSL